MTSPHRHPALLRALVLAALAVLGAGLPRLLVVCTGPDGASRLGFVHAPGACCHAHAPAPGVPTPGGAPCATPGGPCEHTGLAIALSPAPRPTSTCPAGAASATAWLYWIDPPDLASRAAPRPPPATGPPREDQRAALRATSQMLL